MDENFYTVDVPGVPDVVVVWYSSVDYNEGKAILIGYTWNKKDAIIDMVEKGKKTILI